MTRTDRNYLIVIAAILAGIAVLGFAMADPGAWEDCAARCAPSAPARVNPVCYCDARATLPPVTR